MKILYVGQSGGTCEQRARALRALGHDVARIVADPPGSFWARQLYRIANRGFRRPFDAQRANREILRSVEAAPFDVVWVDKGLTIRPRTFRGVRRIAPSSALVAYSPDDMCNPENQSVYWRGGVPLYDLHVTTKSYNVEGLRQLGARDVYFVEKAYDPRTHRPLELSAEDRSRYGADVSFVGQFEPDRAAQILALARAGIPVRVWGPNWDRLRESDPHLEVQDGLLPAGEYAKALNAGKINLGFLRKSSPDRQTARSIEIPACGAFMLAERTNEHLGLFEEGREAEFFGSFDELLAKCRHYLVHDEERRRVAAAGRQRCLAGRYSNEERLAAVLEHVERRHLAPRR